MDNNFKFWDTYLREIKKEITKLCKEKKELFIDLHIHSNYSADGVQSVAEIINSTNNKGFDIIAITDHDSVDVFNDLYNIVKNGLTKPIIIPGIEFTMDNKDYGNQCHILQLFINPKDEVINNDVKKNYDAMFNRSKIQFKRLKENEAVNEILKKNKLRISYDEYINYLYNNEMIPEYDTLCIYLMEKFKSKNITTFHILNLLEKYNKLDPYKDRMEYKKKRFEKLRSKYIECDKNMFNTRFLLSMLAVREVDDDWWGMPSSGSLSVNSYGQLKIDELNEKYLTIFAHPTERKLDVVKDILNKKKSIIGLEHNIRNDYLNIDSFKKLINDNDLIEIKGSDSHDNKLTFYNDMNFYKVKSIDFKKIIREE